MMRTKDYSEQTAQEIDDEVKRIIDEANQTAKELIEANRDKLEIIANALLEYETLDGVQVDGNSSTRANSRRRRGRRLSSGRCWARLPARRLPETPPKPVPPKLPGLGAPAPAPV